MSMEYVAAMGEAYTEFALTLLETPNEAAFLEFTCLFMGAPA